MAKKTTTPKDAATPAKTTTPKDAVDNNWQPDETTGASPDTEVMEANNEVNIIGPTKEEISNALDDVANVIADALNASVEQTKTLKGKVVSPRGDTTGKVLLFNTVSRKIITGFISRQDAEKQKRNNPNIEILNDEKEAGKF